MADTSLTTQAAKATALNNAYTPQVRNDFAKFILFADKMGVDDLKLLIKGNKNPLVSAILKIAKDANKIIDRVGWEDI